MASNFKVRDEKCGCSGLRSCLICESYRSDPFLSAQTALVEDDGDSRTFTFCAECGTKAWLNLPHHSSHTAADETRCIIIRGIDLFEEVISPEEEADIVAKMDASDWVNSQSGRRKQDYGPRVNFKKKKLNSGSFKGLPAYVRGVWERMQQDLKVLSNFMPIELCNLEYDQSRGSSIDPHFDDFWVWGERLVTLNYLSDTTLTLTRPQGTECDALREVEVRIRMRRRSLLVLSSDARTEWMHCIKREDIRGRRIATTWRELSPEFLPGGERYERVGRQILTIGSKYI